MRRMTDDQVIRSHLFLVIFAVLMFAVGIIIPVVLILPSNPLEYSELIEKEIIVESFEYVYRGKGAESLYRIKTEDGEKFFVVGKYEYDTDLMEKKLSSGTKVTVKFFEGGLGFFRQNNVEEIYLDGEYLVTRSPADEQSVPGALLVSILCFAVAAGTLMFLRWNIKHIRQLQEKRDKRIAKKYGKAQR